MREGWRRCIERPSRARAPGIHFPISVRGSSDAADELQCAMRAVGERSACRRVHLSSVAAPLFGAPEAVRVAAAAESAAAHS